MRKCKKMKYKLLIFDMDGTILNTLEDITDGLNYALNTAKLPLRTMAEVRSFIGDGIRKLIERGVPTGTPSDKIDEVYGIFTEYYSIHSTDKTKPYDGILELLEELKQMGCKVAVVSNKADYAVRKLCDKYFSGVFDRAIGERENVPKKPAPDSLNEVLKQLGIQKSEAVYIGDSEVDIKTASNAGMDCIIVDWGFRERQYLVSCGADKIVSNVEELLKNVKKQ